MDFVINNEKPIAPTYAAIADSIITTTKEKTDKEISHDTANALNTLSEIFDKKKIEENRSAQTSSPK